MITNPRLTEDEKTGATFEVIDVYNRDDVEVAHLKRSAHGWRAFKIHVTHEDYSSLVDEAINMANEHYPNVPQKNIRQKLRGIIDSFLRKK